MAMLASKSPFAAPLVSGSSSLSASSAQSSSLQSSRRAPVKVTSNQSFASPTESEFSDVEGPESAKNWDEERVCDWLRSVNCKDYEKLFRKNNINGENLLEMDKAVLQEMGIDKIGDRVRLFLGIKKLRTKAYANQKKRNRVSASFHSIPLPPTRVNKIRTLSLVLTTLHTHHHLPAHPDLQPQQVERCPPLQPTRDIRGNLTASILHPQFQKTSTGPLHDPVHPWQVQKFVP
jgi:hypothetical protein